MLSLTKFSLVLEAREEVQMLEMKVPDANDNSLTPRKRNCPARSNLAWRSPAIRSCDIEKVILDTCDPDNELDTATISVNQGHRLQQKLASLHMLHVRKSGFWWMCPSRLRHLGPLISSQYLVSLSKIPAPGQSRHKRGRKRKCLKEWTTGGFLIDKCEVGKDKPINNIISLH